MRRADTRGSVWVAITALLVGFLATPAGAADPGLSEVTWKFLTFDNAAGQGLIELSWEFEKPAEIDDDITFHVVVTETDSSDQVLDVGTSEMSAQFIGKVGEHYGVAITAIADDEVHTIVDVAAADVAVPARPADPSGGDFDFDYEMVDGGQVVLASGPDDKWIVTHGGVEYTVEDLPLPIPGLCASGGNALLVLRAYVDLPGGFKLLSEKQTTVVVDGLPACGIIDASMVGSHLASDGGDGVLLAVDVTWSYGGDTSDIAYFMVSGDVEAVQVPAFGDWAATIHLPFGDTSNVTIRAYDALHSPVSAKFSFAPVTLPPAPTPPVADDWSVVYDADQNGLVAEYLADGDPGFDDVLIGYNGIAYQGVAPYDGACLPKGATLQVQLLALADLDVLGYEGPIISGAGTTVEVTGIPACPETVLDADYTPSDVEQTEDGWFLATLVTWDWSGNVDEVAEFEIDVNGTTLSTPNDPRAVIVHLPLGETVEVSIRALDENGDQIGEAYRFDPIEVPALTDAPVEGDWELVYDEDTSTIVARYLGETPDPETWGLDADDFVVTNDDVSGTFIVVDECVPADVSFRVHLFRHVNVGGTTIEIPSEGVIIDVAGLPICNDGGGDGGGGGTPAPPAPAPPAPAPSGPVDTGTPSGRGAPLPTPPAQAADDTPIGYIHRMYLGLFGRVADDGGLAYWTARIDNGATPTQVLAAVLRTPEAQSLLGHLDDAAFVRFLYERILGRTPDAAGYEFWLSRLRDGSLNRTSLTDAFLGSSEMRRRVLRAISA